MRTPAATTVILLTIGLAVSGCLGGGDDQEGPVVPELTEFLDVTIQPTPSTDGVWFEPGQELSVEAIAPDNAVGNVTYTWVYQADPFSDFFPSDAIDTGPIAPGASGNLTFTEPGFYEFGHCDPHPWMKHSVAVLEDYDGPDSLTVYIIEGDPADTDSYRFSQQHITVGVGTTVTYVNLGESMHTASIAHKDEAIPTPSVLPFNGSSGSITLEGQSWMNVLVFAQDEAGNAGWGRLNVYVRDKFVDYNETSAGMFNTMTDAAASYDHTFAWTGNVTLAVSVEDPTGMVQLVDVRLQEKDSEADPLIDEEGVGSGTFTATITTVIPRTYVLTVTPNQGAAITYSVDVSVQYDHTPPPRGDDLPCPEPHYSLGHC